ncbi:hypothetical protein [Planktosalinus lacus]|uniref:Uncharacterized protein n=1 Tax=Planktosalinus lacus TaxID=1526573 RepID=A0A8J2V867_9FLAO|nr:hypothetical protein [Planktosalinus lacus]GGD85710.1 hypothetical protein GCM10011312_07200 [Planktosalinus lacus]
MCHSGPKKVTITISATSAVPYPPTISDGVNVGSTQTEDDNLTTSVQSGNVVVFQKAGDVGAISNIYETGGSNVFKKLPAIQSDGTWKGEIGAFPAGTIETYGITYTVDNVTYNQDPKIMINK